MADYFTNTTDLTTVANAIRAKTGKSDSISFPDGFAAEIASIGGGGSTWSRPTEWGAYPSEFQAEKDLPEAQRTMEAIYLLYHHDEELYGSIVNFAGFKVTVTGGYTVERGHMVGSTFTVDSITTVASAVFYTETFTDSMPEYITYRIKPVVSRNAFSAFTFGHTDADLKAVPQMQIETYGRFALSLIGSVRVAYHIIHVDVLAYGTTTSFSSLFLNCYNLKRIDNTSGWDTSMVTRTERMFRFCSSLTSLDVSGWDTSMVTDMGRMFESCSSLTSLDVSNWDTSAVTDMTYMFESCASLTSLDVGNWDTSAVTSMPYMFRYCFSLTLLDLSGWDTSAVTSASTMFVSCSALIDLDSCPFHISVSLSNSSHLSHDSLMSVINNLATVTTTQTLTLGSTNLAKLTAAEIAIATNKGWTVA